MKKLNTAFTSALLAATLALSACSYTANNGDNPNFTKSAFNGRLWHPIFSGDPSKEFVATYGETVDGEFTLPAIPVKEMDKQFLRQRVDYVTSEKPGTIIVNVSERHLYFVEPGGKAMRYGVGVGKAGFEWAGEAYIGWKKEWPTWTPPDEMIARKPELVKYSAENGGMEPGLDNPLGARALYLFKDGKDTLYRLHGTPVWSSIGTAASSGCIRLINQDIVDLYSRVNGRTKVVVQQ
jgi:lipoprotein-anchoring transpeptidase ErfK/SrfK